MDGAVLDWATSGPAAVAFGLGGLAWGFAADRISARWPAHEDGSVRGLDWRTIVVAVFGAVALAAVPVRFSDPAERLLFGAWFAAMVLLLATDLDQRLMPDVVTLPLALLAAAALAWGGNDLVNRSSPFLAIAAAVAVPAVLWVASLPFGTDAFGGGDVKFLVSAGLMLGLVRAVLAVFAGAIAGGVVIVALLAMRRISLRSYVPYGPFLLVGATWAALLPAAT